MLLEIQPPIKHIDNICVAQPIRQRQGYLTPSEFPFAGIPSQLDPGLTSYAALSGLSELDLGFLAWSRHAIPADLPHPGPICQVQLFDGEFAFDNLDDE